MKTHADGSFKKTALKAFFFTQLRREQLPVIAAYFS